MDKTTQHVSQPSTNRLLDEGVMLVVAAAAAEGVEIVAKSGLRWCIHGVRGVRLENLKIRGRRMTSRAAFRRFVAAIQDRVPANVPTLDQAAANKVLKGFGL